MSYTAPLIGQFNAMRQPGPPEGRMNIPLVNSGTQAPIVFTTGSEVFSWTSEAMAQGGVRPSSILSAWIDASMLVASGATGATGNLVIDTGLQRVLIPVGTQGYFILTCRNPALLKIFVEALPSPAVVTGPIVVVAYNFNILAIGESVVSVAAPSSSSGGTVSQGYAFTPEQGQSPGGKTSFPIAE